MPIPLLIIVSALFAAFDFAAMPAAAEPNRQPQIGVILALSGPFAKLGAECRQGYELARRLLGGDRRGAADASFIYADSRGEAKNAIAEFHRLVREHRVQAILAAGSYNGMPINGLSRSAKIPILGVLSHAQFTKENPYAFQFWPATETEALLLADFLRRAAAKSLWVLTADAEYPQSLEKELRVRLAVPGTVYASEHIDPQEQDFRPLVARLRVEPPAFIVANVTAQQMLPLVRQIREQNLPSQILANFWIAGSTERSADAFDGVVFPMPSVRRPKFRVEARLFRDEEPSAAVYSCFASMAALLQALVLVPEGGDSAALYSALSTLKEVRLPDEALKVKDRIALFHLDLMRFTGGEMHAIDEGR